MAANRPHCRKPEACAAKGQGHCRGCAGAVALVRFNADPECVASRNRPLSESTRAKLRAGILSRYADPAFRASVAEQARRQLDAMRRSPETNRKRSEAITRALSKPDIKERRVRCLNAALSARTAKRVGIPLELVPLFRAIRNKTKASEAEVRSAVLTSPEAKALAERQQAAARLRAAGPAPAIGSPQRAAWTRRVNGNITEARTC